MAEKKEVAKEEVKEEAKKEETKNLNIFAKLAAMRVELQNSGIKKTGRNDYGNYDYYELSDFLPKINEIALKYGVFNLYELLEDKAVLHIMDYETKEQIDFYIPLAEINLKGANAIQNVGGLTTYTRRYLYMIAYEVAENDEFDSAKSNVPKEEEPKEIDPKDVLVEEVHVKTLESVMKKKGVSQDKILERYKKTSIEELTMEDFMRAMSALEKMQDTVKEENVDLGFN